MRGAKICYSGATPFADNTMSLNREPCVAGLFYPADPGGLQSALDAHLGSAADWPSEAKAVIVPHAGYIYSGAVAGRAYAALRHRADKISRVVLLGPAHRLAFSGIALPSADAFTTPLGAVPIDRAAIDGMRGLPGVTLLDRAFDQEHCIEIQLPFLQRILGDFTLVPMVVGDSSPASIDAVLEHLWGGDETLIVVSSDLSHYQSYDSAKRLDAATSKLIEAHRGAELAGHLACGFLPIAGLLRRAAALDLRATTLELKNSGDSEGDRTRVVGYGAYSFEAAESARLPDAYRNELKQAARTILAGIGHPAKIDLALDSYPPPLLASRRTFVTLREQGELRGCIGTIEAHQPLVVDVVRNTIAAATSDSRFKPVSEEEAARLDIHISILSHDRPISFASEDDLLEQLRPGIDGLLIRDGAHRSLFLPQVWHMVPDRRAFLAHLKGKAGLAADHWSPSFQAWRFTTESF
jgi:AmmeMemoRadiSam system protein B/AmmeMemoRadiSam system protein A